ncbi:hypothetical protein [Flavobacterium sp. SM2513]|uniref:hypothetical protein n=1 Tax=Flavobacterium sp. SM2513 TaxID=3424766 RepID=UPI003D7FD4F4
MAYKRIKGGEKNLKSGQRWTKEEIIRVYYLYKKLNGSGLHEHNPEIQKLAHELDRTVRSTEAQALMFRSLERLGDYSHGNMNKLSLQVWNECELKRNFQTVITFDDIQVVNESQPLIQFPYVDLETKVTNEENTIRNSDYISIIVDDEDTEALIFSYKKWNQLLVEFFFNSKNEGKEVPCFFVYEELFDEISNFQYTLSDFELSIEKELRSKLFSNKFNEFYESSRPQLIEGRNLRKDIPKYFGLLIYLIFSLGKSQNESLSVSNVYTRINNIGKNRFKNKWSEINTAFARDILELVWYDLQDWSTNYKAKKLGYFSIQDPKSKQRKYVSRIERHGIFNSGHFRQLFDVLIEIGIAPKENISAEKWLEIFIGNKKRIGNAENIIEYLKEDSGLKDTILKFINDYYQNNFNDSIISSHSGTIRKPSIPLLFCLKELPLWDNKVVTEDIYFRAFSNELEEDIIKYQGADLIVEHEYKEYSKKIEFDWIPKGDYSIIKGDDQRYSIKGIFKWLIYNRDLEEWVEALVPTNALNFLLIVDKEKLNLIKETIITEVELYETPYLDYKLVKFENLQEAQFNKLNNLLGYRQIIEGKIELVGNFLLDRRRLILKEFESVFKYLGPVANPKLIAKCEENNQEWELIKGLNDNEGLFTLGSDIPENVKIFIYENQSNVKSHFSYEIGELRNREPINVVRPYSKDQDGVNIVEIEIQSDDIFDIPRNFNREDFDTVRFNTWHQKLWIIFKSGITDYITKNSNNFIYDKNHNGEKLLNYLSVTNCIKTYEFVTLIKELNPKISNEFSKRIMHYWRDLGYINFQTYGEIIRVSPSNLFFIESPKGLKAFLTGFRNSAFIEKLVTTCRELNLIIKFTCHNENESEILPYRIEIYDKLGDLDTFKNLCQKVGIEYINNIENPYNRSYAVYQLACFYTQRSIEELDSYLSVKLPYTTDHHRKLVFDAKTYTWKESIKDISNMIEPVLIRYDGFKDRQMIHIYKGENGTKILDDYALCSFRLIENTVFFRKRSHVQDNSDFYVPLNMKLPFWIERGLLLINAKTPVLENYQNKTYRVYENIHDNIIQLIEAKLNQQCNIIN